MRTPLVLAFALGLGSACAKPQPPIATPKPATSDEEPVKLHTKPWPYWPYVQRLKRALASAAHLDPHALRIGFVDDPFANETHVLKVTISSEGQVLDATNVELADAGTMTGFSGLTVEPPPAALLRDDKLVVFLHLD